MSAPRVLCWAELFWPHVGGVEVLATAMLPALRARGYEITVVTSHEGAPLPDRGELEGIPIHRFAFRDAVARRDIAAIAAIGARVGELLRVLAPDLVHVTSVGPSGFFCQRARRAHAAPMLLSLQQEVLRTTGDQLLLTSLLRSADWVTAVSAAVLEQARHVLPDIAPRSSVIPNVVPLPREVPTPLPRDEPQLLCLGRLVRAKGFDLALEAFAALRSQFPRARLVVAGDGAERPRLERQASALGVAQAIDFIGWVAPAAVPALLNRAAIVLMPSRREGLPLVGVQAALMARPIVGTRVGGVPEIVLDGHTGLLLDPEDAGALARAVGSLLADPERAQRMGDAARRHARAAFDPDRAFGRYEALYDSLIGGAAARRGARMTS